MAASLLGSGSVKTVAVAEPKMTKRQNRVPKKLDRGLQLRKPTGGSVLLGEFRMKMHRLDHVNLRTSRLAEMVAFYHDLLGMKEGPRPDFNFPGAWIYIDEHPIIHLVEVKNECATVQPKIEHFALQASGLKKLLEKLKKAGIDHTVDPVPGFPIVQVNLADVDGNHIHIDFNSEELNALD